MKGGVMATKVDPRHAVSVLIDMYHRTQAMRKAIEQREQAMTKDEITLNSGKKYLGQIVEEDANLVHIKNGRVAKIKTSNIKRIHRRRYDTVDEARESIFNFRIRSRFVDMSPAPYLKMERDIKTRLSKYLKEWPVWEEWMKNVKGCGEITAAVIWAYVDIHEASSVSKLWTYAGHGLDSAGQIQRLKKGQKRNWCSQLKTALWNMGESMVKKGVGYRKLFDQFKEDELKNKFDMMMPEKAAGYLLAEDIGTYKTGYYVKDAAVAAKIQAENRARGGPHYECKMERKPGHINARAKRRMRKVFLAHLWTVWRKQEGLPVEPVWIIANDPHHRTEIPIITE
jgi:hypothetical protein